MAQEDTPPWSGVAQNAKTMRLDQRNQRKCALCQDVGGFITSFHDGLPLPSAASSSETQAAETPFHVAHRYMLNAKADYKFIVPCPGDPFEKPGIHSIFVKILQGYRPHIKELNKAVMNDIWNTYLETIYIDIMTANLWSNFSKGAILNDRFVVGDRLGGSGGSFNKGIFLATDRLEDSPCILKLLNTKKFSPEVTREIDILRKLSHPNIIELIDFYCPRSDYEFPWFAVDHCDLGTLEQFLYQANDVYNRSRQVIPEPLLWQIFKDLAEAIRYCHFGEEDSDGNFGEWDPIYHRDIILSNIFLTQPEEMWDYPTFKLGDFGCAVSGKELKDRGTRLTYLPQVSPWDYPPEGNEASVAGDVYQVGRIMWSLISHREPHQLEYLPDENGDQIVPETIDTDLHWRYSGELKKLIDQCLYHYAEGRPSSKDLVKLIEPDWVASIDKRCTLAPWFNPEA